MKLIIIMLFLSVISLTGIKAQQIHEAIPATGGNASGSGGSVSYSIGQLVYTLNSDTSGSVLQGVQQPYEISVNSSTEEAKEITLDYAVYPNPTADFLKLKTGNNDKNLSCQLYDNSGKLLEIKKIEYTETLIDMSHYAPAVYFLKVLQDNHEVKIFKIIKTQ